MSTAPGPGYSSAAYLACLEGRADQHQQQSAASQIILLHAVKGDLLASLTEMLEYFASEEETEANGRIFDRARAAVAKCKKYSTTS